MSQHDLAAACRDLLEEAERLEHAFHKNFDRLRLLGEPKPFLQGPRYATRIARAGLENDLSFDFLGPARAAVTAALATVAALPATDSRTGEPVPPRFRDALPPFRDALRRFLAGLEARPREATDFAVEPPGKLGPLELRRRLADGLDRDLWRILTKKTPLLDEALKEADDDSFSRRLFRCRAADADDAAHHAAAVARLIHHLSPHTWGPFVLARRGFEHLDWLPSWSTVFIPDLPASFTEPLPASFPAVRLEARGRVLAMSRRRGREHETVVGPDRWRVFPEPWRLDPVLQAFSRWIDFLLAGGTAGEGYESLARGLLPGHLYWLEHHAGEKLGFLRLVLEENKRLAEHDHASRRERPRKMLELLADERLALIDAERTRQLRALALLQRVKARWLDRQPSLAESDLPEIEWISQREGVGCARWRFEIQVSELELRGHLEASRSSPSLAPLQPLERALRHCREFLHHQEACEEACRLARGRLCGLLLLVGARAYQGERYDEASAFLREALEGLPPVGSDLLRYVVTLYLGLSEFQRGLHEAAWGCAKALEELAGAAPNPTSEAWHYWLLGRLHLRAGESGPGPGSEEEDPVKRYLGAAVELHVEQGHFGAALRTLVTLQGYYEAAERAEDYLAAGEQIDECVARIRVLVRGGRIFRETRK